MRPYPVLLLIVGASLLVPRGTSAAIDGPNVETVHHAPADPQRGNPVDVSITLGQADNVSTVLLTYCRVQSYACGPALNMTHAAGTEYLTTIPWHPEFFRGVTKVGYDFQIRYEDGHKQFSPIDHVPARPTDLPADAAIYYYYSLPAPSSPGASIVWVLAAWVVVAVWLRR